jgi:hypothetical protein
MIAVTVRGTKGRMPGRRRSLWGMVAARPSRTVQEALVADMLRAVSFRFREQWVLEACGEGLIFDFLVEERVLVECSYSNQHIPYAAWEMLKRRAAYYDYKFRLAKQVGTFTTISLLEVPGVVRPGETPVFPFPQTARNYQWTDHIVTTIGALGEQLIALDLASGLDAQPTFPQEELSRWLATGTQPESRKPRRRTQHQSGPSSC